MAQAEEVWRGSALDMLDATPQVENGEGVSVCHLRYSVYVCGCWVPELCLVVALGSGLRCGRHLVNLDYTPRTLILGHEGLALGLAVAGSGHRTRRSSFCTLRLHMFDIT